MKYKSDSARDFITIVEDSDPQRTYLIEDYCGTYTEIVMFGDEYHDQIGAKIEGFLSGIAFAGIDFSHRTFSAERFGEGDGLNLVKHFTADDEFELYILDGDVKIELEEVE